MGKHQKQVETSQRPPAFQEDSRILHSEHEHDRLQLVPRVIEIDKKDFSCGESSLDDYLQTKAGQHQKRNIAKATVAVAPQLPKKIAGYYTLNTSTIDYNSFPVSYQKKLPYGLDIPSAKIGRLAVDLRHQGQGLGEELLIDAFYKVYRLSFDIAIHSIIVDSLNEKASAFWQKHDFIPFEDQPGSLFLPIATVGKLFN